MTYTTIDVQRDGAILRVALNRPDQLNALDYTMTGELTDLWHTTATDREVRVVVLTGVGRGFCAGADVGDLAAERRPRGEGADGELSFQPGIHLDVPVVVAVNGVCAGGGLHFVADADIVIASDKASFIDPHVSVGQVTALEPISLALRVPIPTLMRMAILGRHERLSATEALAVGLVSEVVAPAALLDRARELAALIASNSPAAVAASRRALRALERRLLAQDLEDGWAAVQKHWEHPDSVEGPIAFGERREPLWAVDHGRVAR